MVKPLREIICEFYVEQDVGQALDLIQRHDMTRLVENVIQQVNQVLSTQKSKPRGNEVDVSVIAVSYLTRVNEKVGKMTDLSEKHRLKSLLAQVSQKILLQYIAEVKESPATVVSRLYNAICQACAMNGYDEADLETYFPLREHANMVGAILNKRRLTNKGEGLDFPWYEWKGSKPSKQRFIDSLYQEEIIRSKREFEKLFQPPDQQLSVKINSRKLDHLMMIIVVLSDKKVGLIQPRANRGCFQPLHVHGVDFDEKKLFSNTPSDRHYAIWKNPARRNASMGFASEFINGNKIAQVDIELVLAQRQLKKGKN